MRIAVVLCVLLGCKGDEKSKPTTADPEPPTLELVDGEKLRCTDGSCEGVLDYTLGVGFLKVKPGTKVTAAGKAGPPAAEGIAVAVPGLEKLVAGKNLSEVTTKGFPLDIMFEAPGAPPIKGTVQVPGRSVLIALYAKLKDVEEGGITFDGETPETKTGSALFLADLSVPQLFGDPKSLTDIGRVAVIETNDRVKKCGAYKSADGMASGTFEIRKIDATVTVRNRITGKKLATKKFAAVGERECPTKVDSEVKHADFSDDLKYDEAAVVAWLREQ